MKSYFYSDSSLYGRHMLVKIATVCIESGRGKKQGEKFAHALPYSMLAMFKMASPALTLLRSHQQELQCCLHQAYI